MTATNMCYNFIGFRCSPPLKMVLFIVCFVVSYHYRGLYSSGGIRSSVQLPSACKRLVTCKLILILITLQLSPNYHNNDLEVVQTFLIVYINRLIELLSHTKNR